MAIDGSGIIASDDAHDIQQAVREAWRAGKSAAEVAQSLLAQQADFCTDALHTEIYWAALAQSLWDIGAWPSLPTATREQALSYISSGPCVDWQQLAPGAAAQRRRALAALATQLSRPNPKPIKAGQARQVVARGQATETGPALAAPFTPGALLAVLLSCADEAPSWGACVLLRSEAAHGKAPASDVLALIHLQQAHCPTLDEVGNAEVAYRAGWGFLATCELARPALAQAMPRIRQVGQLELSDWSASVAWQAGSEAEWRDCWQREAVGSVLTPVWEVVARVVWDSSAAAG